MIDTIVLILSRHMYEICDPDKFVPSAQWADQDRRSIAGMQSRQNPTKKDLLNGVYKPRLTLSNRVNLAGRYEVMLKIELSLPKLHFGNNFNELQQKDFSALIAKLVHVLADMGVATTAEILASAPVSAIHYSKNMLLTDGSIPYHFISKIKEANIKLSLDVNQTDYRNDGHSYRWHCNAYEVVFYDKIRDLAKAKQSEKRGVEKDSAIQISLLDAFKKRKKMEVLRMEVRLNKRQKIKHLFKLLGIKSDLTFKSLFKPGTAKKVLLHYIDELESRRPVLLDYKAANDKALLAALVINNSDLSAAKILQMFGLKKALESHNLRELRSIFANGKQRSWQRLVGELNKIKLPQTSAPLAIIREHLVKFKSLSL